MKPEKELVESQKRNAALEAVKHVKDRFIVGLGSGSTAAYAIEAIGERIRRENLVLMAVPTSYQAFLLAAKCGVPITTLEEHPIIDLTIDGADQIDPKLNLIKGMGAALAREKIVASMSRKNLIIADESKKVKFLGEDNHPVPVEVLPFAITAVKKKIEKIGGKAVLREGKGKLGPVITDNGNAIIEAFFGVIEYAADLEKKVKMIPGVIETGLFVGLSDTAYVGTVSSVVRMEKKTD